jgi:CTP synthase
VPSSAESKGIGQREVSSSRKGVTPTKYIFVTGGVMSGLGKGVTSASIAKIIQLNGFSVSIMKIDPYLNVDAGTMNPVTHGEVFVTDDGGETDMDIGTYERFLDQDLTKAHNLTTGRVYLEVIESERRGEFLGKCVQIIPHVTDAIKSHIRRLARDSGCQILIVECGGTVGDIEGLPFYESFRQMRLEDGPLNTLFIHVTLAPVLDALGEQKTKPTQHSVQELRRIGIQPDLIVVRSKENLSQAAKEKISLFTSVESSSVVSNPDCESVYSVPEVLDSQGLGQVIFQKLKLLPFPLPSKESGWDKWRAISRAYASESKERIRIAMVGKYVSLADSYVSVNEALSHAGAACGVCVDVEWVDSEKVEEGPPGFVAQNLKEYHGLVIPQGFGKRGTEGKITVANFARENSIPFLGLCLGFQMAVVSFARNVLHLNGANSTEINPDTSFPVIDLLPEQKNVEDFGGTMRLGGHDISIVRESLAYRIYGRSIIRQRHRHRYEVNPEYRDMFSNSEMRFSGFSDNGRRVEILEVLNHPFYFATQYHPEYISRPGRPEPAFLNFVKASLERRLKVLA